MQHNGEEPPLASEKLIMDLQGAVVRAQKRAAEAAKKQHGSSEHRAVNSEREFMGALGKSRS
jgi:hypothetical protein